MSQTATMKTLRPGHTAAPEGLIESLQQGDRSAFDTLMGIHERQVFGVAWRLLGSAEDAQDAAQEVFLRLYRFADRIDPQRPLEAWLYRVTVNVCRDLGRRRGKRRAGEVPIDEIGGDELPAGRTNNPATIALARDEHRLVQNALIKLGEKERAALVLRDLEGLTTQEVAQALGTSEGTVRTHLCRARLKMKKFREKWRAS